MILSKMVADVVIVVDVVGIIVFNFYNAYNTQLHQHTCLGSNRCLCVCVFRVVLKAERERERVYSNKKPNNCNNKVVVFVV